MAAPVQILGTDLRSLQTTQSEWSTREQECSPDADWTDLRSVADNAVRVQYSGREMQSRCGQLVSDADSVGSRLHRRAGHCLAERDRSMPCASLHAIQ